MCVWGEEWDGIKSKEQNTWFKADAMSRGRRLEVVVGGAMVNFSARDQEYWPRIFPGLIDPQDRGPCSRMCTKEPGQSTVQYL